eukprot:SAG22_NODE_1_length_62449_cov_158.689270_23_plen_80_part_00
MHCEYVPVVPHCAAGSVSIQQEPSGVEPHVRQDATLPAVPETTMRHGSCSESHDRWTSSSAWPSQQSSKPSASNSCSLH